MREAGIAAFADAIGHAAAAIAAFPARDNAGAAAALDILHGCRGRAALCGMGKCGHIGRKIAATLASTGVPATFLHPAEALHGDLGFIGPGDCLLALSNSGETPELLAILPFLERMGIPVVAITGKPESALARRAAAVIHAAAPREADPLNLAPTASTTLMLAIGDALAAGLQARRGFRAEDYAALHPGGILGRRLLASVGVLMHRGEALPLAPPAMPLRGALAVMTSKRLGAVFAVDPEGRLLGLLTDGDIRRILQRQDPGLDLPLDALMTSRPRTTTPDALAADALRQMEDALISILPVVDAGGRVQGAIHLHDLVRAGIG